MLLLLLSLFSNYDLIHCNQVGQGNFIKTQLSAQMSRSIREIDRLLRNFQQEIHKQKSVLRTVDFEDNLKDVGLLDYSVTPIWWGESTAVDQNGANNTVSTFLTTPEGHGGTNSSEEDAKLWKKLNPVLEGPQRPKYPLLTTTTLSPLTPLTLDYTYFPNDSFTTRRLRFSTPIPTMPELHGYFEPLTGSPSKWFGADSKWGSSSTTPEFTLSPSPLPLLALRGPFTSDPKTSTIFNFFPLSRSDYTPIKRVTKANRITPMTHQPQEGERTLSKAQAWVRDRQWTKPSKTGRSSDGRTKGLNTTVSGPALRVVENQETLGQLFEEDAAGFLQLSRPKVLPSQYVTNATKAGAILYQARNFTTGKPYGNPNKFYIEQEKVLQEGPMMVFLLEGSQLITEKKEAEVREVLFATEFVVNHLDEEGEIGWTGLVIVDLMFRVSRFISMTATHDINMLRTYAKMFHNMLQTRDTREPNKVPLSDEVNTKIIDYAESLYEESEHEILYTSLRKFQEYTPTNSSKVGWDLCREMVLAFLSPYRRLKDSDRGHQLMSSIRSAIRSRFHQRRANGELLVLGGKAITQPEDSRQRKGIYNSLKRRISIKRRLINRTKHDTNGDAYRRLLIQTAEYPMLRSLLPITRTQKRFRVITPRQLRSNAYLNIERPTMDYFYRRLDRPIHPPNQMLELFPQATKALKSRRLMQPTEVTKNLKESVSQRRSGGIKAELIRRIVEDSSYSDEEALLKRNLAG